MFDVRKGKLRTLRVKMVVGNEQRQCSGIPTEKTNIGRGVQHSDSTLQYTTSL